MFETKDSGIRVSLAGGMVRDTTVGKTDYALVRKGPMFERWAALLTRGAMKYGKNNWILALSATDKDERAKTCERFVESACRHFEQWLVGDTTEDHAAAVIFNVNGLEAMKETEPRAELTRMVSQEPATHKCTPTDNSPEDFASDDSDVVASIFGDPDEGTEYFGGES